MNGVDLVAKILKAEGVEWISCFPSNPVISAVALIRFPGGQDEALALIRSNSALLFVPWALAVPLLVRPAASVPRDVLLWAPLLFVAVSGWMMVHVAVERPGPSLWGGGLLAAGFVLYMVVGRGRRGVA